MDYKEKAVTTFLNNMKTKMPDLSQYELDVMELSFSSGFNVGLAQDKSDLEQAIALQLLSI